MTNSQYERFMDKVLEDEATGCWLWIGSHHPKGHGTFMLDGRRRPGRRPVYAHRAIYEHWFGPIAAGVQIHHGCQTPACVNPEHLYGVTPKGHAKAHRALRTACRNGHPLTPENRGPAPNGYDRCLVCHRENARKHRRLSTEGAA